MSATVERRKIYEPWAFDNDAGDRRLGMGDPSS